MNLVLLHAHDMDCYNAASVANTDTCIGLILDALEMSGYAEDTVVVLTTGHGVPFPFMICNLTRNGTGLTLMIRNPRIVTTLRGGSVIRM